MNENSKVIVKKFSFDVTNQSSSQKLPLAYSKVLEHFVVFSSLHTRTPIHSKIL